MISQISGKISRLNEDSVTLFLNGLYYELMIPSGLFEKLGQAAGRGDEITLFTINFIEAGDKKNYHYPRLVGFTDPVDKEFFQLFTTVSGMGIKKGLKCLTLPIREIAGAIETRDAGTLSRLPGIGNRLAEKIIAELSGKMARFALAQGEEPLSAGRHEKQNLVTEALAVLMQLQYNRATAEQMIDRALKGDSKIKDTEDLIAAIFRLEAGSTKAVKR